MVRKIPSETERSVPLPSFAAPTILQSMQAYHFKYDANPDSDSPGSKQSLRVIIAYSDTAAGKRAMRVMDNLGKNFGDAIEFKPLLWSFDLLANVDWGRAASREAAQADILIFATSDANPFPTAVEQWAEAVIWQKRGTAAAVIALFGPNENPSRADSSRMAAIHAAVEKAGLDFFAPAPHHELDEAIIRIRKRTGMARPLFDNIARHQHPGPRWERSAYSS